MAARRIPWGLLYAAGLAVLLAIGVCSGDDGGLTPAEREACTEYVASENAAARDEGRPPPAGLPDCEVNVVGD